MRVQPVHFQGTVEGTWRAILAQFKRRRTILPVPAIAPISQTALHA